MFDLINFNRELLCWQYTCIFRLLKLSLVSAIVFLQLDQNTYSYKLIFITPDLLQGSLRWAYCHIETSNMKELDDGFPLFTLTRIMTIVILALRTELVHPPP
jgi:hypothetical protein